MQNKVWYKINYKSQYVSKMKIECYFNMKIIILSVHRDERTDHLEHE